MEFAWYTAIYKYVELNKYPTNASTNIKRRIHAQASKYKVASGGRLISLEDNRELLHEGNALEIITKIHQESHMGILNTNRAVNKAYICQEARRLVTEVVQACQTCQFRARVKYKKQNKAQIFKMAHRVLQMVAVDAIGPITPTATKRGNRYVLTAIDYLTRFPIAKVVKNINEKTTANFLYDCIIVQYGVPEYILSDRGANFISEYIKAFLKELGCRGINATSHRPQTNGCCERLNQTLAWTIAKIARDHDDGLQWDRYVDSALLSIRCTTNATTGFTPSYLLYGYEMRTPMTWIAPQHEFTEENIAEAVKSRTIEIENKIQEIKEIARIRSNENTQKAKIRYDTQVIEQPHFVVGDKVLMKDNTPAYKLADKWIGPLTIFQANKNGTYHLTGLNSRRLNGAVNGDKLKKYFEIKNMDPDVMVERAQQKFQSWIARK